jgi:hypothetical protein
VSEEEYDKALKLNVCDVDTRPSGGYPLVLSTQGVGIEIEEINTFEITPEIYITPLFENKRVLEEIARVMDAIGHESIISTILSEVAKIEEVYRKAAFLDRIDELIYSKLAQINKSIEDKIKDEKLVLSGREILEYLSELKRGSHESFKSKFYKFEEYVVDEVLAAEREICEILGINAEIFSKEIFPEINIEEVERLKNEFEKELIAETYLKSRDILRRIKTLLPKLEEEINLLYEVEFIRGLREVCKGWNFPKLKEGFIAFELAENMFIQDPQPISYFIGNLNTFTSNINTKEEANRNVVVLTGANSGGKTSLLELIVQIQILTQMGLPVPAKNASIDVLDEIYFFKRKKLSYGAGAFESALKNFTSALVRDSKKLILIDEFEAITEPGAAVKMLSEFLRIGNEKDFYMVVVSHMGKELKLDFVRVDGIEASGLDDNLNLIVNRQPKFGVIGRSTPELVVERVFRLSRGKRKEILRRILDAFDDGT